MAMQSALIHLAPKQKSALKARARKKGSSVSAEVREAIDLYLAAASPAEMEALDLLSRQAAEDLRHMDRTLDDINAKFDRLFAEIGRLRATPRRAGARK